MGWPASIVRVITAPLESQSRRPAIRSTQGMRFGGGRAEFDGYRRVMALPGPERRPLTTRDARWAQALAAWLARRRVAPNAISVASIFVALIGTWALVYVPFVESTATRALLYVAAAAMIQLRLLCNLLDGLVAVEGGLRTKTGDVFNELPDRIADIALIAGAGYAVRNVPHAIELGWIATSLALLTAYVRVLGKSIGGGMHFIGPMAKPHRMAALTLACLAAAAISPIRDPSWAIVTGLAFIAAGCVVTISRRVERILATLNAA